MHYRLNGRQCLISVAPTASCWANATEDKSSLQSLPSFDCNLARTLWDHTGWLHLFWAGRFKDTWNLAGKHPQLNTHTHSHKQFPPLLDVLSFLAQGIACSEARLARGAPWPFSTQAGTTRRRTLTHKHTPTNVSTAMITNVHAIAAVHMLNRPWWVQRSERWSLDREWQITAAALTCRMVPQWTCLTDIQLCAAGKQPVSNTRAPRWEEIT